jgi:hypothetical protein
MGTGIDMGTGTDMEAERDVNIDNRHGKSSTSFLVLFFPSDCSFWSFRTQSSPDWNF